MNIISLKNGSQLVLIPIPGAHSITTSVFIRAGSASTGEENAGIAHLAEHLFLRGTSKYPTSKHLTWELEKLGCNNDAWTDREFTYYFIQSPAESWQKATEILLDRLQHSLFSNEDIEKEKKIISEEISHLERNGEKTAFNEWLSFMEENSDYSSSILGTKNSIQKINREQILKYVEQKYLSTNTIFTLVGKVPSPKEATEYYNSLLDNYSRIESIQPPHPQNKRIFPGSPQSPIKIIQHLQYEEQVVVAYGFRTTDYSDQKAHIALNLIETLLLRGWSSRLKQQLRAKYGLIYKIDSKLSAFQHTGYFTIVFTTTKKNIELATQLLHQEFQKLVQETLSEEELAKAKGYYNGQLSIHSDESLFLNYWYGKQLILFPQFLQTPSERQAAITSLTPQAIQETARKYFLPTNWSAVILANGETEMDIPSYSSN
jgi:predicted Zn-dependent peptidase